MDVALDKCLKCLEVRRKQLQTKAEDDDLCSILNTSIGDGVIITSEKSGNKADNNGDYVTDVTDVTSDVIFVDNKYTNNYSNNKIASNSKRKFIDIDDETDQREDERKNKQVMNIYGIFPLLFPLYFIVNISYRRCYK